MRTPRVYLPLRERPRGLVELGPEESRHLATVLRRGRGDRVVLLGAGAAPLEAEIASVGAAGGAVGGGVTVSLRILREAPADAPPLLPWTVAAAVVKGEGFDHSLRMAAELGIARFTPLITERTVVRPDPSSRRPHRWDRISREASKQCGRTAPLEVFPPATLGAYLASWREPVPGGPSGPPKGWILLPGAPSPAGRLGRADAGMARAFLIGPEGGFSPGEVRQALEAGLEPLGFPLPILRTPTAIVLVAALGLVLDGGIEG